MSSFHKEIVLSEVVPPSPPSGYVKSKEFGVGQVVCVNGDGPDYEVTIDTERGRKTFTWSPEFDMPAMTFESARLSATLSHRTALLCRERWATDGVGRPTQAFIEALGAAAANWVEWRSVPLTVPVLLEMTRERLVGEGGQAITAQGTALATNRRTLRTIKNSMTWTVRHV